MEHEFRFQDREPSDFDLENNPVHRAEHEEFAPQIEALFDQVKEAIRQAPCPGGALWALTTMLSIAAGGRIALEEALQDYTSKHPDVSTPSTPPAAPKVNLNVQPLQLPPNFWGGLFDGGATAS